MVMHIDIVAMARDDLKDNKLYVAHIVHVNALHVVTSLITIEINIF